MGNGPRLAHGNWQETTPHHLGRPRYFTISVIFVSYVYKPCRTFSLVVIEKECLVVVAKVMSQMKTNLSMCRSRLGVAMDLLVTT